MIILSTQFSFILQNQMNQATQLGDKYILLDTLGVGGMAEIFRGKLIGDQGFEKLIVIKKLLKHLSKDEEMVSHFIDEARLAALLQHDNIACIYDFGNIDGNYFIAMEYLFGKDLFTVIQKLVKKEQSFPPEFALYITSKICDAMEYAHNLKGLQNNPLHIIHRDLTPHNIFITYEGKVKVLDFGIAKNEMQENRTQVGVVKGKVSYMSPEQVSGANIDHRSDIYSIGILLYEMLSGKKLYTGNTAELIKKALSADYTPLRQLVEGLPDKLYSIVETALQSDPDKRYQNCSQMLSELEECLYAMNERVTTKSLKDFSIEVFKEEYKEENEAATQIINKTVFFSSKTGTQNKTEIFDSLSHHGQQNSLLHRLFQSNILFIPATAAVVLIVGGLGWQFISGSDKQVATEIIHQATSQNTVQQGDQQTENKKKRKPKIKERIETLLLSASEAYTSGNLINTPDSAYNSYQSVLILDEENVQAEEGLKRVANQLDLNIRSVIDQEDFEKADSALAELDRLYPHRWESDSLDNYYKQKKQQKINTLFTTAEEALNANKLTTPADSSALKYYNDIKALDKNSPLYKDGYRKIADRYAALATDSFKNLKMDSARHYVHEGLLLVPTHPQLLRLKDDLNRKGAVPYVKGIVKGIKDSGLF